MSEPRRARHTEVMNVEGSFSRDDWEWKRCNGMKETEAFAKESVAALSRGRQPYRGEGALCKPKATEGKDVDASPTLNALEK